MFVNEKYQNYEEVTKLKLYDYCDMTESEEEKFRQELYEEQNEFLRNEITTEYVIIHLLEDNHFLNEHYLYTDTREIEYYLEYFAIKDGCKLVRFQNGNIGFVAYYNRHENGFEIIPTEMTEEEFEKEYGY